MCEKKSQESHDGLPGGRFTPRIMPVGLVLVCGGGVTRQCASADRCGDGRRISRCRVRGRGRISPRSSFLQRARAEDSRLSRNDDDPWTSPLRAALRAFQTPRASGSQMNLCICNWNRTSSPSARIRLTRSTGSMPPKIGEMRTAATREVRSCRSISSFDHS